MIETFCLAGLVGTGSIFLGGAIGRAKSRGDRLAVGQCWIAFLCLLGLGIMAKLS